MKKENIFTKALNQSWKASAKWFGMVNDEICNFYAGMKPKDICDHLWIEWDHGRDRKKKEFIRGTVMLKNPECVKCGVRKYR